MNPSDTLQTTPPPILARNFLYRHLLRCAAAVPFAHRLQFSSLWSKAALYPHDMEGIPDVLHFVSHNDSNITSGQGSLGERPLVGSEGSCRTTEDGAWVLDTQGQKILWLPTLRGSYRRCCGGKLLLQGSGTSGGQLTLLDLGGKLI